MNDREIIINKLFFDQKDNIIKCDITLFDRSTNRITRGTGETEIKEGICYVKKAVEDKLILKSRYENYLKLYREIQVKKRY